MNLGKMDLTENAKIVLERRYLKRDKDGNIIETPEEMIYRVAKNIASADLIYNPDSNIEELIEKFYNIISSLEFLPNSPTLMNAGREIQQLSACFVLPVEDSMESIFEAVKNTALIHKSGGGTGFSFSRLRPKNDRVLSTGGVASGPVSFMKVFNAATEAVKQGGTRRGANMGILRVDHPDILEFITTKENSKELTNFNISVALTEEFMSAVEENTEYSLVNPHTKEITGRVNAGYVFDLIVEHAWKNGEPGIIFIDRINKTNPTPEIGEIESTNPCGEQPLLPYESCNLGSINLSKMIKDGKIDYQRLEYVTKLAVHFLDNVIDMNKYPIKVIEEMTKRNRKIGLGIMGFADMLIKLKIPYNSEEALKVAEEVMKFIREKAIEASSSLAEERGVFPNFEKSIFKDKEINLRNATLTTIAPTGTLSIIAGVSSGIEPIFALTYIRNILDNDKLLEVHPLFEETAKKEGFYSKELMKKIAQIGSIQNIEEVPSYIKRIFVTAFDITPFWHLKMQSAFQKYTDNAVSKTVNFPNSATKEDVKEVFILAYKEECKGVTIYRDRSREEQVLSLKKENKNENSQREISPRDRPSITKGTTEKVSTGCGNLYVTINRDEKGLCEVFSQMGKAGGCAASQLEATSRLISLALRSGVDADSVIKQLRRIRCPSPLWGPGGVVLSCPDAIAMSLERCLNNGDKIIEGTSFSPNEKVVKAGNIVGICPDCGQALIHEEGCAVCRFCGYTKCS